MKSFERNSNNPSDAIMINLSDEVIRNDSISGFAVTPISEASLSPMDLVMARPGTGG